MNVKGKNIIITGGSLGIGKETAKNLVEKGANVLITGRSEQRLIESRNYTGAKIIEFDIFDGLESCASKFRANSTKNQIFRPPGCRD